jgi:hypothetical protein
MPAARASGCRVNRRRRSPDRAPAKPRTPAAASVASAPVDIVTARDQAILAAIRLRPWTAEGLVSVLPAEPGQTDTERRTALSSALIRLRVKKQAIEVNGQWRAA